MNLKINFKNKKHHNADKFNRDYFENGVQKQISLYENFRWLPEKSFLEAHWFINHMRINLSNTILDFGCAKGFFVKALRILGYKAYGYAISQYALSHSETIYVSNKIKAYYDFGFCKDVLEHSTDIEDLENNLRTMRGAARRWLLTVPLAKSGKYLIPEYEKDLTHIIKLTAEEWIQVITKAKFTIYNVEYFLKGMKENWPGGDLFLQMI